MAQARQPKSRLALSLTCLPKLGSRRAVETAVELRRLELPCTRTQWNTLVKLAQPHPYTEEVEDQGPTEMLSWNTRYAVH